MRLAGSSLRRELSVNDDEARPNGCISSVINFLDTNINLLCRLPHGIMKVVQC